VDSRSQMEPLIHFNLTVWEASNRFCLKPLWFSFNAITPHRKLDAGNVDGLVRPKSRLG